MRLLFVLALESSRYWNLALKGFCKPLAWTRRCGLTRRILKPRLPNEVTYGYHQRKSCSHHRRRERDRTGHCEGARRQRCKTGHRGYRGVRAQQGRRGVVIGGREGRGYRV